jgi:hypothetical protein
MVTGRATIAGRGGAIMAPSRRAISSCSDDSDEVLRALGLLR